MAGKHENNETSDQTQANEVAELFDDLDLNRPTNIEEEETDEATAGEEITDDEDSTETEEEEESSGEEGAEEAETSEAEEEEEGSEAAEDDTEVAEGDDLETLKAQNAQLLAQVNELSGVTPVPKPAEKPAEGQENPKPEAEIDFLGDQDLEELLDSKENFNKFMNQVYQQARRDAAEQTLLSIPSVVGNQVRMQTSLNNAIKEFYDDNPELAQARPYVGRVADQVASENPDWTMSQIFAEVATRAKKGLGLSTKPGKKSAKKPTRKPGLPSRSGGGSRPKPAERISEVEQDIADTFDI